MMIELGFRLAAPLLERLDAERAHRLAIAALRILPLPAPGEDDSRLAVGALGLNFANPVGLAAGFAW